VQEIKHARLTAVFVLYSVFWGILLGFYLLLSVESLRIDAQAEGLHE